MTIQIFDSQIYLKIIKNEKNLLLCCHYSYNQQYFSPTFDQCMNFKQYRIKPFLSVLYLFLYLQTYVTLVDEAQLEDLTRITRRLEAIEPNLLHLGIRNHISYRSYNPLQLSGNRVIFTIGESNNRRISDKEFDNDLRSYIKRNLLNLSPKQLAFQIDTWMEDRYNGYYNTVIIFESGQGNYRAFEEYFAFDLIRAKDIIGLTYDVLAIVS